MANPDVARVPDSIVVITDEESFALSPTDGHGAWKERGVCVTTVTGRGSVRIRMTGDGVKWLHLRWRQPLEGTPRIVGDHWERGYGDLEWRGFVPERMLPWYFLIDDGDRTSGGGVKTQAGALAGWRLDPNGISLWLDVRSGGVGVRPGNREVAVATVIGRCGEAGESAFSVATMLCQSMCDEPRLPARPVYGGNNWYYAYGNSSDHQIREDAKLIADLAPSGANRPFMVIDDGWQVRHDPPFNGGPWDAGNARFPDMASLASGMKEIGTRPGIWLRPLWTRAKVPDSWLFAPNRINNPHLPRALDPTVAEVHELIATDIRRVVEWGFELIKHDFTTFDICGRWGFEMPVDMTADGWSFSDRSQTTAEVLVDLYRVIREAAGDALVLGCNTVGHLAAGLVELQRTGDDTSGIDWDRTRQRGVNTLAFRMPQHNTFFSADADCVGLTTKVPWEFNRQWLDLVARSGTPLFVSAAPEAVGPEQAKALREAFELASRSSPAGEPLDWLDCTTPKQWRFGGETIEYDWYGRDGAALRYT